MSASAVSPTSAISLASPRMLAVRQYYNDHGLKTAFQADLPPRNGMQMISLADVLPRRHSILSPGGLATRLDGFAISSPRVPRNSRGNMKRLSIAEESREMLLSGVNQSELAKLGSVVSRRKSVPRSYRPPSTSRKISFDQRRDRLREWGHVYFGNFATADILVKAVHLRKAERDVVSDQDDSNGVDAQNGQKVDGNHDEMASKSVRADVIVRARVNPGTKERRPFLIQRRFNLDEMRASLPKSMVGKASNTSSSGDGGAGTETVAEDPVMRSKSSTLPQTASTSSRPGLYNSSLVRATIPNSEQRRIMPIRK